MLNRKVVNKEGVIFDVEVNDFGHVEVSSPNMHYIFHPDRYQEEVEMGNFKELK